MELTKQILDPEYAKRNIKHDTETKRRIVRQKLTIRKPKSIISSNCTYSFYQCADTNRSRRLGKSLTTADRQYKSKENVCDDLNVMRYDCPVYWYTEDMIKRCVRDWETSEIDSKEIIRFTSRNGYAWFDGRLNKYIAKHPSRHREYAICKDVKDVVYIFKMVF